MIFIASLSSSSDMSLCIGDPSFTVYPMTVPVFRASFLSWPRPRNGFCDMAMSYGA
jgi:hypothetical protein